MDARQKAMEKCDNLEAMVKFHEVANKEVVMFVGSWEEAKVKCGKTNGAHLDQVMSTNDNEK